MLLVLADEVSIETAVLERWRAADGDDARPAAAAAEPRRPTSRPVDVLAGAARRAAPRCPSCRTIPSRVPIAMAATPGTRDADVAAAVASAIAVLRSR